MLTSSFAQSAAKGILWSCQQRCDGEHNIRSHISFSSGQQLLGNDRSISSSSRRTSNSRNNAVVPSTAMQACILEKHLLRQKLTDTFQRQEDLEGDVKEMRMLWRKVSLFSQLILHMHAHGREP